MYPVRCNQPGDVNIEMACILKGSDYLPFLIVLNSNSVFWSPIGSYHANNFANFGLKWLCIDCFTLT